MSADGAFEADIDPEAEPSAEPVTFVLLAEERMEFINQGPAISSAGEVGPVRPAVMLGVDEIEGEFAVNLRQAADPVARVEREGGRPLEVVPRRRAQDGSRLQVRQDHLDASGFQGPEDLD